LIDAFCGAGFFTKRVAPKFERVIGIDWDRFAIDAARKDARPNETYIAGDVALELRRVAIPTATLIVDPPATGLTAEMRHAILDTLPETMIYVSCNPPTLARDLAALQSHFSMRSITPFDMFPQTAEIEAVAHLKRNSLRIAES
jgi:23S rRNA (uracil1939-C5)-methyltransferase